MKKVSFLCFVLVGFILLMVSSSAEHYWNDEIRYTAAYGTVKIDGVIDAGEWDDTEAIEMRLVNDSLAARGYVNYQGGWESESNRSDSDYQGTYKIKWDNDYIYFLEIRVDNTVNLNGTATEPWTTDGTLIFVQVPDSDASVNADGVVQNLFYTVGKDGAIGGDMKVRVNNMSALTQEINDVAGGSVASSLTGNGFVVEFAVPWSMFNSQVAGFTGVNAGDIMGLSYVVHDSDITDSTGYDKQFCYAVDNDMLGTMPVGYDYGGWGTLELLPEVIAEEIATEVVADTTAAAPVTQVASSPSTAPQTSDVLGIAIVMALASGAGLFIKRKNNR